MESLIHKLEFEAFRNGVKPRSAESVEWFKNKVKSMKDINRYKLLGDEAVQQLKSRRITSGHMYMYFYDPKHRKELPYYDNFPLIVGVQKAKGGFYGINLHYLPLKLRAILFDALLETTNNKNYDENTKFKINYAKLKKISKLKLFKPCFKHYLTKHVQAPMAKIEAPEWEVALFLPVHQFRKATAQKVWADSRKMAK